MKVSVTGATGFLGGRFVRLLRDRGDDVVALTRRPSEELDQIGCSVVEVDLTDAPSIEKALAGSDAVVHIAGQFEVGVTRKVGEAMVRLNRAITEGVVDAAASQGMTTTYVSTINVFGNTHGMVVDESYTRAPFQSFVSYYEASKTAAHDFVSDRIREGAPIKVCMPSAILGPGDHSTMGDQLWQAAHGKLRAVMLAALGINVVHVDDVANGLLLVMDKGPVGQEYITGGDNVVFRDALRQAAELNGHNLPFEVPTWMLQVVAPLGPLFMPRMGLPPNLRELIATANGTTYWVHDGKARRELGYTSRPLEETLRSLGD